MDMMGASDQLVQHDCPALERNNVDEDSVHGAAPCRSA